LCWGSELEFVICLFCLGSVLGLSSSAFSFLSLVGFSHSAWLKRLNILLFFFSFSLRCPRASGYPCLLRQVLVVFLLGLWPSSVWRLCVGKNYWGCLGTFSLFFFFFFFLRPLSPGPNERARIYIPLFTDLLGWDGAAKDFGRYWEGNGLMDNARYCFVSPL
jgi:hypothetical protein